MKKFVFAFPSKKESAAVETFLSIKVLEKAFLNGNMICKKLNNNEMHVIEKKTMNEEELYRLNIHIFRHLQKQSNAIVAIIQNIVHPILRNDISISSEIQKHCEKIHYLEHQVTDLQEISNTHYDKTIRQEPLPEEQAPWSGQIKDAAIIIIKRFEADCKNQIKRYRSLREVSDIFFDCHDFKNKPKLLYTKSMFYENVKKAHRQKYWGMKVTERE